MMATSESTALAAVRIDAKIGRSTDKKRGKRGTAGEPSRMSGPTKRASTTKTKTGTNTVPMTPSGSRTKILISSQVSCHTVRIEADSVANRVAGQLEKDVLERRDFRAEVGDRDSMLRDAADHQRHEIVTLSPQRDSQPFDFHRMDLRNRPKTLGGCWVIRGHDHRALRAMASYELRGHPDIDDPSVVD